MNFTNRIIRAGRVLLGYDTIIRSSGNRREDPISTRSEDYELDRTGRLALTSKGRDLLRKLAIAGFAVRKHLQYVAKFDFRCAIPNEPEYSAEIKRFIYVWSRRKNCDIAGRHSLPKLIKLIETHRIIDGDVGVIKLASGKLQLIESDRIANPPNKQPEEKWVHGVQANEYGKAIRYAIHKRNPYGGFTYERNVSAENMILCGYITRGDQYRGIPLIASAINLFQDVYEGIEYALAKAKIAQLMGLMTKRDAASDQFDNTDTQSEASEITKAVKEKFGHNVVHLDLGVNDDAKIIESTTPSNQFQQFMHQVIQLALSALDIPYSFYDGTKTNYYGTRGALDNYIESCGEKQDELIEMLHEITDWRLRLAILNGEIPLPPRGLSVDDVLWHCDWIGARMPHWRLIEDAKGYLIAIQSGLLSPQLIAALYGIDFEEVIQEISVAQNTAKSLGVNLAFQGELNIGV